MASSAESRGPRSTPAFLIEVPPPIPHSLRTRDVKDGDTDDDSSEVSSDSSSGGADVGGRSGRRLSFEEKKDCDNARNGRHRTGLKKLRRKHAERHGDGDDWVDHSSFRSLAAASSAEGGGAGTVSADSSLASIEAGSTANSSFIGRQKTPLRSLLSRSSRSGNRSRSNNDNSGISTTTTLNGTGARKSSVTFSMDKDDLMENLGQPSASVLGDSFATGSLASVQSWSDESSALERRRNTPMSQLAAAVAVPKVPELLAPLPSPYSAHFKFKKPSTAPTQKRTRTSVTPGGTYKMDKSFNDMVGEVGARQLNTSHGMRQSDSASEIFGTKSELSYRYAQAPTVRFSPSRTSRSGGTPSTGGRRTTSRSGSRSNCSRGSSRKGSSAGSRRSRSTSPGATRRPRKANEWAEFTDEVHFSQALLYYDENQTIPVTSRNPSKLHPDLNRRRVCNEPHVIDMSTYPTSNVELALIAASGNGPFAQKLVIPPSKDVSDHGFLLLNKFSAITDLDISGCAHLGDASAVLICHVMNKLRAVDISSTSITDVGISDITQKCIHLESIAIRDNQNFKDKGCMAVHQSLKMYKTLRAINFSGSRCFGNEALIQLLSDGGGVLTDIDLTRCIQINDLGLMGLRRFGNSTTRCKNLRVSTLPIHDSSMTWIAEGCKELELLDLQDTKSITDASLSYLSAGCTRLKTLRLTSCHSIGNTGLENFLPSGGRFLTSLDLTDCSLINDKGALCIAENCTKIVDLNIFGVPHITDHGISKIAARCIKLTSLNFSADINSLDTSTKARVPHIGGEGLKMIGKWR